MSSEERPAGRRITMVKKRLASGEPCAKCMQAEEMLQRRNLWERIDRVVWADESDPQSEGMLLADKYQMSLAPFFLVEEGEQTEVVTSVIQLTKKHMKDKPSAASAEAVTSGAVTQAEVEGWAEELSGAAPQVILEKMLKRLGASCWLAFSGAEDVALIDMAARSGLPFSVFCLDTGRLHAQTYRFLDKVRSHYGIQLHIVSPEPAKLEPFVQKKGLFSFYEDGHSECCGIRKVEPLRRVLSQASGWVTGQRRDQSPTRTDVPEVLWDRAHTSSGMPKANPLAAWTQAQVWQYIREQGVPYNELHDQGYISIGCEPCTRASRPGEHERAGRWWWEETTKRECGLHLGPR